jgi:hypothetical protein
MAFNGPLDVRIVGFLGLNFLLLLTPLHLQPPVLAIGFLCLFFNLLLSLQEGTIVSHLLVECFFLLKPFLFNFGHLAI